MHPELPHNRTRVQRPPSASIAIQHGGAIGEAPRSSADATRVAASSRNTWPAATRYRRSRPVGFMSLTRRRRIHHLHRETDGVRGRVFGQSLKRSRIGRGSYGRSHGVEYVIVGQVPASEFGSNLDEVPTNGWVEALQQRKPFVETGTLLLAVSHWATSCKRPEADLRVDLSHDAPCFLAPT